MPKHEVEITISPAGEVRVHIKGVKGKACLAYAKWFEEIVGKLKNQTLTSEYYEPDVQSRIDSHQQVHDNE